MKINELLNEGFWSDLGSTLLKKAMPGSNLHKSSFAKKMDKEAQEIRNIPKQQWVAKFIQDFERAKRAGQITFDADQAGDDDTDELLSMIPQGNDSTVAPSRPEPKISTTQSTGVSEGRFNEATGKPFTVSQWILNYISSRIPGYNQMPSNLKDGIKLNAKKIEDKLSGSFSSLRSFPEEYAEDIYEFMMDMISLKSSGTFSAGAGTMSMSGDVKTEPQVPQEKGQEPTQAAPQPAGGQALDLDKLKKDREARAQADAAERETAKKQIAATQAANAEKAKQDAAIKAAKDAAMAKPGFQRTASDKLAIQQAKKMGIREALAKVDRDRKAALKKKTKKLSSVK